MIEAGDFDKRVDIQAKGSGVDTEGGPVNTWPTTVVSGAWARFDAPGWRSARLAGSMQAEITHEISIRYRAGITAAMRVVYGGRNFEIKAITDDAEEHEALVLHCGEGLADG